MSDAGRVLPVHYELTRGQYASSGIAITVAALLLVALAWRLAARVPLGQWWVPLVLAAGVAAADFMSGLIHWAADTWGRDDSPVLGPRLLVPFRVHHVNPDDFLRRRFIETNGEVAMIAAPVLLALLMLPLDAPWGPPVAVFGFAFCGVGVMTNQIHQWAHQPSPPWLVCVLQTYGLLLGRDEHAEHHRRPHDRRYCITTGWLNTPLDAMGFFARLETFVTATTGLTPRNDDLRYAAAHISASASQESRRA